MADARVWAARERPGRRGAGAGAARAGVALGAAHLLAQFSLAEEQRAGVWHGGHGAGRSEQVRVPVRAYVKFFGRFALLLVAVYVILSRSWFPVVAVLGGIVCVGCGCGCGAGVRIARRAACGRDAGRLVERSKLFAKLFGSSIGRHDGREDPGCHQAGQRAAGKAGVGVACGAAHSAQQSRNIRFPITSRWNCWFLPCRVVFFLWLKARLSVENPGGTQQCMEALLHNPMGLGVARPARRQRRPRRAEHICP